MRLSVSKNVFRENWRFQTTSHLGLPMELFCSILLFSIIFQADYDGDKMHVAKLHFHYKSENAFVKPL